MPSEERVPLPENPALAAVAAAFDEGDHWAEIVDDRWGQVYITRDMRLSMGGVIELAPMPPAGSHYFGPEATATRALWRSGMTTIDLMRPVFSHLGGWVLADTPNGRDELRGRVHPALVDLVDGLTPGPDAPAISYPVRGIGLRGTEVTAHGLGIRIRDDAGRLAGTALIAKPPAGMSILATAVAAGDLRHFARTQQVAKAARRPAAVLFADLESSSALSRRLSTASYFALGRRLVRAADECIIDEGGIVGRHVGDGVTAFFLAETLGSESAAAAACITAARGLRDRLGHVAARSGIGPEDIVLRFGLHWGATLYVGQVLTGGRAEVTALGDEVNEAARIEACATGGRAFASKALIERLDGSMAASLGLDTDRLTYTPLGQLRTATEKARRDAPAIAVCEV